MKSVHILSVDSTLEVIAIRAACEYWDVNVTVTWVGNANQIVELLRNSPAHDLIILAGHGDEEGLCLPELAEEIKSSYQFQNRICPEDFASFLRLPKSVVLNSSCC